MKLIIDIPEEEVARITDRPRDYKLLIHKIVATGTPFDSVIEDIKAELTKDYVDDNPDNFRYTTIMLKDVLDIIDKHIADMRGEE